MPCAIVSYPPTGGNVVIEAIYPTWADAREALYTIPGPHPEKSYELSKVDTSKKIGDIIRITPGWK